MTFSKTRLNTRITHVINEYNCSLSKKEKMSGGLYLSLKIFDSSTDRQCKSEVQDFYVRITVSKYMDNGIDSRG